MHNGFDFYHVLRVFADLGPGRSCQRARAGVL